MRDGNPGRTVAAVLLWWAASASGFGLTEFGSVADRVRSQSLDLPPEAPLVTLMRNDAGLTRQAYVLRRTVAPDGSFRVEASNGQVLLLQQFRKDGILLSSTQTDSSKGTTLVQSIDPTRTKVHTIVTVNGKTRSDNTTQVAPDFVLQSEINNIIFQSWKAGIRDGLLLKSLSPDGGMAGDFQIVFRETDNPLSLSTKYEYPEEFKKALTPGNYLVADMSLLGIGGFFFPHHFYLAYRKGDKGLEFVAYYGENPKTAMFQFTPL